MTPDLFTYAEQYPRAPGYRNQPTSYAASEAIKPCAATLRTKVLNHLRQHGPATADEVAESLHIDRLSVRPRLTELKLMGKVRDTGTRRPNASGKMAICWDAVR